MRPRPLNHTADIIAIVGEYAPTKACSRAIKEGQVTVLGGFKPAVGFPRIIVRVTSVRGRKWFIALVMNEDMHEFTLEYPKEVVWRDWDGSTTRAHPVYDGMCPEVFLEYCIDDKKEGLV